MTAIPHSQSGLPQSQIFPLGSPKTWEREPRPDLEHDGQDVVLSEEMSKLFDELDASIRRHTENLKETLRNRGYIHTAI